MLLNIKKKKAFTLVELLIVIIIIGILAGMLLIAVGSAVDRAEATKIINTLRSYKSATLMYYGEYNRWPSTMGPSWDTSLDKYVDRSLDRRAYYMLEIVQVPPANGRLFIGLVGATDSPLVKSKGVQGVLAKEARGAGLYSRSGGIYNTTSTPGTVYMPVK